MEELVNTWKKGKEAINTTGNPGDIIRIAKAKKKEVLYAHYGTILILTATLIGLGFFFYKTPFVQAISHVGIGLMLGVLLLRIVIEIISVIKSTAIQLTSNAAQLTKAAVSFYRFRKTVHGPVTLAIVGSYIAGFYLLTPEFSNHIALKWMIAMHLSFVAGAIFLVWVARQGIRKEIINLEYITGIQNEMVPVNNEPVE